jgi:hypothetical protein
MLILGAFLAAVFSDRFFVVADFKAEPPRRLTLNFAFFVAEKAFFLETGRFFQENREAIKHEPGNRREGSGA